MKKFLLMAAAALTTMSMSAQLYVTGLDVKVGDQTNSWDAAGALQCAEEGDYYTFKAKGEFTISTNRADWDAGWKDAAYKLSGSWNVGETSATANLTEGYTNIPSAKPGVEVSYKVKKDLSAIEAAFENVTVEPVWEVHGQLLNGTSWEQIVLEKQSNGTYSATATIVAGEFGMRQMTGGTQTDWIGGAATVSEANHAYTLTAGANSKCTLAGEYNIVWNPEAKTISFNTGVTPPDPTPDMPEALYAVGMVNGCAWSPDAPIAMTKSGNTFVLNDADITGDRNFSFITMTGLAAWDGLRYGAEVGGGDVIVTLDNGVATLPLVSAEGNVKSFKLPQVGKYNITCTFAEAGNTIKIEKIGGEDPVEVPEHLYVVGTFKETAGDWKPAEAPELTKDGNKFSIDGVTLESPDGICRFSFITTKSADWGAVNSGFRYSNPNFEFTFPEVPATENATASTTMTSNGGSGDIDAMIAPAATYNMVVTFDGAKINLELIKLGSLGIENVAVEAAAAAPVYYNLQGVRVAEPVEGQLYIVVRGNKVAKELVR